MTDEQDGFVSRWSRRKRERREREGAEAREAKNAPLIPEDGEPPSAETVDPDRIVESLPDIEALDENSDFTAFLRDGVPEQLRRRALRKLWRLNPVFANLDGLNDYDEDFSIAAPLAEGLKTLYQVGKGMADHPEPEADELADRSPADQDIAEPESHQSPSESAGELSGEHDIGHLPGAETGEHIELIVEDSPVDRLAAEADEFQSPRPVERNSTRIGGAAVRRRWDRFKV